MHYEDLGVFHLQIAQPDGITKFGTDSILLSDFAARKLRSGMRIMDLCTGCGIVALLLAARRQINASGIEIDPIAAAVARNNGEHNHIPLDIINGDLRTTPIPAGAFDLITCNPPYFPSNIPQSPTPSRRAARSEETCSFDDVCRVASHSLKFGGLFFAVWRPERLCDAFYAMRTHNIEPKCIRFVAHTEDRAPFAVLLEGKKGAAPGLIPMPTLLMNQPEVREIYAGRYGGSHGTC
ncbi:MAG: methyltransferase [Clostridia bacterium]|nr:methyltransferase [Clostridia bacterium]